MRHLSRVVALVFLLFALTCSDQPRHSTEEPVGEIASKVTALSPLIGVGELPPRIQWGGRAVAVDIHPTNSSIALAAAESGGLFQTTDNGVTWKHVDSLSYAMPQGWIKAPSRIADVKYTSTDGQTITVTVHDDLAKGGGIWQSFNGGTTWTQALGVPTCMTNARVWGIGYSANKVYVASDCGVYVATVGGTFSLTSLPTPAYAVLARGATVDVCTMDGHRRSTNSGATFGAVHLGPSCVWSVHGIDGPANNTNVVLVATAEGGPTRTVKESDQGGADGTWTNVIAFAGGYSRELSVKVVQPPPPAHQTTGALFDVWFGDGVGLGYETCKSTSTPRYCPLVTDSNPGPWQGLDVAHLGGHTDVNGIAVSQGCPKFMVQDGGVFKSTDCGMTWTGVGTTQNPVYGGFNALQIFSAAAQIHPTWWSNPHTDIYFGTMDNSFWVSSTDNGFSWTNHGGLNEGHSLSLRHSNNADDQTLVGWADATKKDMFVANKHYENLNYWAHPTNAPSHNYPVFYPGSGSLSRYFEFATDSTTGKTSLYSVIPTWNGTSFTMTWTMYAGGIVLPAGEVLDAQQTLAANGVAYAVTVRPATWTRRLIRARELTAGSNTWTVTRADNGISNIAQFCGQSFICPTVVGINTALGGVQLLAADIGDGYMKQSWDSGDTWTPQTDLTQALTANFQLALAKNELVQPHTIAFDPASSNRVLVGTESLGIWSSTDTGASWTRVPESEKIPRISSIIFDEFRDTILVSSYGRGLWTLDMPMFFEGNSVQRSNRKGDWQPGFYKAECGDNEALVGVSKRTNSRWSHGALCRSRRLSDYSHTTCTVRDFSAGDSRGTTSTGDWDGGFFKGECASNEYGAGVSQGTDGSIKSILCCAGQVTHASCSTVTFEFGDGHEEAATPDWDSGFNKGDCGTGRYVGGMSRDALTQVGAAHRLLCCSP